MLDNFSELYKFRTLVWALVKRHLAQRYRGSVLGFLWTFLNPLCLMLVYTLVFKYYIKFNQVPNYTIFLFCGLLPWIWLSTSLIEGTSSITSSGHLITKSLFPAHILPTVTVLTNLINFLLSLPLLFLFMLAFGVEFKATLLSLPLLFLLQAIILQGFALALGALNVYYRDVQHLTANFLTLFFFLCPIVYPASSVPERFRFILDYNPFAVLVSAYHQVIFEGVWISSFHLIVLSIFCVFSIFSGNIIFNRYRENFAEML